MHLDYVRLHAAQLSRSRRAALSSNLQGVAPPAGRPWQQPGWQSVDRLSVPPDLHGLAGSALGELVSPTLALSPDARPPAAEVARVLASFADAYPA